MSGMRRLDEKGAINSLLLPLIVAVLLLLGAIFFGAWAFSGRQDYKNNVDAKIAEAVVVAKAAEDKKKDAEFAEASKSPLKAYNGPSAYGSLVINYPKTWSGYVSQNNQSDPYIDGYFAPNVVPDVDSTESTFALRIQVVSDQYSDVLGQFDKSSGDGSVNIKPYSLPKVPSVVGAYVSGEVVDNKQGFMVILPLRNTTLQIWTESPQFQGDFNDLILANASFSP
jgi:hypothetical protein